MNDNNEFHDPLDDVIARATHAFQDKVSEETTETPVMNEPPEEVVVNKIPNPVLDDFDLDDDDDEFGKNDLQKQIEEEERRDEEERQRRMEEARIQREEEAKNVTKLPPQSLDKQYQNEAIGFQENNLAIVTGMVEKVKAKYHLVGGIPEEKMPPIMGDLMEEYYYNGETITPKFEEIILKNWVHADVKPVEQSDASSNETNEVYRQINTGDEPANINIEVPTNTPVTVNIDDDVVGEINKSRVININVREVSDMDVDAVTVIENSPKEGIIRSFETGIGYTPITLPVSAYKCFIKPLNFFELISLVTPDSRSKIDYHMKRWSIIYDHLKNPSIGEFEDFEDLSLLEWGILASTSSDEEPLEITCGNPKCQKQYTYNYSPRTIIHPNPERLPKEYHDIHNATPGKSAIELFNRVNTKKKRYKFNSGVIVEINEPSAHEYLTVKLPLIMQKYAEKRPNDPDMNDFNEENLSGDPTLAEFSYKMAIMMRISAIVVPPLKEENYNTPHEYRYTNWDDIESQINLLGMEESMALMKLISNQRDNAAPVDFYLSDVTCPHCGRVEKRIPVNNMLQNLLFRMSRRFQDTEINLNELD